MMDLPRSPSRAARLALLALSGLALGGVGGCGTDPRPRQAAAEDPVMTEAIEGQLLVDPDLSQQNLRNYAVVPPGPVESALPTGPDLAANAK